MLDLLSAYLNTATTVEEKHHIAVADRALVRAQLDYEHVIEELLALDDDADSGVTLQSILAVYRTQLFHILTLHAVQVNDDISLKMLANLVTGLLDIDNYDNPQQLLAIADEEAPTIEKFCILMEQVTQHNADELMQYVEDVSDTFLIRLKSINQAEQHEDENELMQRRERIHAFHKFEIYLESVGGAMSLLPNVLRSGVNPSMPFVIYAKLIDNLSSLEGLPPRAIARDLFGAALVSEDGHANPGETVKACLEQFVSNPQTVSQVMVEVRQLMIGYQT